MGMSQKSTHGNHHRYQQIAVPGLKSKKAGPLRQLPDPFNVMLNNLSEADTGDQQSQQQSGTDEQQYGNDSMGKHPEQGKTDQDKSCNSPEQTGQKH